MASQVTVTGVAGAGVAVTAAVITDVLSFTVNCASNMLELVTSSRTIHISINAATTFTVTKSGNSYTVAIS